MTLCLCYYLLGKRAACIKNEEAVLSKPVLLSGNTNKSCYAAKYCKFELKVRVHAFC